MFPSFVSKTRMPTSSRLFPSFCKCFVHEVVCVLSQRSQVRWPFLMHWGVYCISAIKEFWHSLGPEHSWREKLESLHSLFKCPSKLKQWRLLLADLWHLVTVFFGRYLVAIDGHSISMYVATVGSVKWVEHGRATAEISWGLTSLAWSRISLWPWDGSEPVRKGPWSWSRDDVSAAISCIFQKQNKHMP